MQHRETVQFKVHVPPNNGLQGDAPRAARA
jgi:hypothetical protein